MSKQSELRDELCAVLLRHMQSNDVTIVEATVACMGAAAVVMGCLPPDARETLALELDGKLLEHANHRAKQLRSGEFDRLVGGH